MARGTDDTSDPEDGPILSPDELDITQDEHVAELDDGRFVVSPNDPIDGGKSEPTAVDADKAPAEPRPELETGTTGDTEPEPDPEPEPVELDRQLVHEFLASEFDDANSRYGFDVTAKFDGKIQQRQMVSNDVVTIFESLMLWYAQQIDSSTPVEEVLGILLMESNVPIRYPAASLQTLLESSGLSPEDSIADLVEAVGDDEGFRL
jgi:hypothetical protein